MVVKKDTTLGNVLSLPMIYGLGTAIAAYVNAEVIFLLRDEDYFAVDASEIGRVSSDILFYALLFTLLLSIGVGYLFDMFGRRTIIMGSLYVMALVVLLMPYTAPSIVLLTCLRIVLALGTQFTHSHPLVVDYIKAESRGKATALQSLGSVVGECFTFLVLMTATMNMEVANGFALVAVVILVLTTSLLFMIREPDLSKK